MCYLEYMLLCVLSQGYGHSSLGLRHGGVFSSDTPWRVIVRDYIRCR